MIKLKPQHLHVHSEHVEVQFYLDLNSALWSDVSANVRSTGISKYKEGWNIRMLTKAYMH